MARPSLNGAKLCALEFLAAVTNSIGGLQSGSEEGLDKTDLAKAMEEVAKPFKAEEVSSIIRVGDGSWNGLNIRPPMMSLGDVSTLGVIGVESGKPKISFSLDNKPFSDDGWFHTQKLVASLSFIGGLYDDEQHVRSAIRTRA